MTGWIGIMKCLWFCLFISLSSSQIPLKRPGPRQPLSTRGRLLRDGDSGWLRAVDSPSTSEGPPFSRTIQSINPFRWNSLWKTLPQLKQNYWQYKFRAFEGFLHPREQLCGGMTRSGGRAAREQIKGFRLPTIPSTYKRGSILIL